MTAGKRGGADAKGWEACIKYISCTIIYVVNGKIDSKWLIFSSDFATTLLFTKAVLK